MKSKQLSYFFFLLVLVGFGLQSCDSQNDKSPRLTEAERLQTEYLQAFEEYRALPVPPPLFSDQAVADVLHEKTQVQDTKFKETVNQEIERLQTTDSGDEESFQQFVATTKADIYTADVLEYKENLRTRTAPSKEAMAELDRLKTELVPYYPELKDLNNFEVFQWLSGQLPNLH